MTVKQRLSEVGRALSKKNEDKLRTAHGHLTDVLDTIDTATKSDAMPTNESERTNPLREAERSWGQVQALVADAVEDSYVKPGMERWDVYVMDMYDDYAIVNVDGAIWSVPWAIQDNVAVLGEPTEVVQSYVSAATPTVNDDNDGDDGVLAPTGIPSTESDRTPLTGDVVPLVEKAVNKDGSASIKVIAPGWGSSGYYSADVLKRDGPQAFPAGTHSYWNHPTESEDAERPERDLRDLAAVLKTPATWQDDGAAGPGLYADVEVMPHYRDAVEALAPHIGVSIRALGRAKQGEADGRSGPIVEGITQGQSVDWVTRAGAGGQAVQLFERARVRAQAAHAPRQESAVELKELQEKYEAQATELARLREREVLRDAEHFAARKLREATGLMDATRERLLEALRQNPPTKDGALDEATYTERIEAAVVAEREYLGRLLPTGQITGMGGATRSATLTEAELDAQLKDEIAAFAGLKGR